MVVVRERLRGQKSELLMTRSMAVCLDVGILGKKALLHLIVKIHFESLCLISSLERRFYFAFFLIHQFQG